MRLFALLELVAAPVVRPTLVMQTSGKDHGFRTVANSVHFSLAAEILIPYSPECGDLQGFSLSPSLQLFSQPVPVAAPVVRPTFCSRLCSLVSARRSEAHLRFSGRLRSERLSSPCGAGE